MSPTILAVDDEPVLRESLAAVLADESFEVRTAGDGRVAPAVHSADPADLIVSDAVMPEADGYHLVAWLRKGGDQTPVIPASAGGRPTCTLPAVYGLGKPFDVEEMLVLIGEALDRQ
jgi:DNA-binding response OmpR family regulator